MPSQNCSLWAGGLRAGWGENYTRQNIHSTPCWIDIQMNGPLLWLDRVLRAMGPPTHEVSSIS